MKSFVALVAVLVLGMTLSIGDAEAARRFGSGKSMGMQRQATPPAKTPDAATAPRQAAPAAAPAAQPRRSWMGPLAGLAAGLGLAALASHFGFGEEMASFMMMALLAFAVIAAIGFFMRKRTAAHPPALAGAGNAGTAFQYAGNDPGRDMEMPASTGAGGAASASNIPANFDVAGFVRNAKVHFIRLQAANDSGNLDDIRAFTTPEMFAEISLDIAQRAGKSQVTDVIDIEADVIDVAEEDKRHVVSVRFTGHIREDDGPTERIDETWHLIKPIDGATGWVVAGIQQLQ